MIFAEQHDHGFPINKQAVRSNDYLYIHNIGENKTNCILEVQPMGKELQQAFVEKNLNKDQSYCFIRPRAARRALRCETGSVATEQSGERSSERRHQGDDEEKTGRADGALMYSSPC